MTGFVLDNSVTMRWCFEETSNAYAEDVLERMAAGEAAIVPVLWRYELGAVLAKAERKGTVTAQKAADFVAATRFLNITIDHDGIDQVQTEVYRLAVAWRLTGYDAVYLELALRKNLPLATLDQELAQACHAAGGAVLAQA